MAPTALVTPGVSCISEIGRVDARGLVGLGAEVGAASWSVTRVGVVWVVDVDSFIYCTYA